MYYLAKFEELSDKFSSYSKNYICKHLQIYDIINYSTSICPFESGKCWKEGEKLQKFEYLKNEKSFLEEIKNIFQNKNLIKNSGHKL